MSAGGRDWLAAMLEHHRVGAGLDTPATMALPRFQRDAAVRLLELLDTEAGALLADDVGLGKTFVSLAVLRSRPAWRPALVLAPAAVLPAWQQELGGMGSVATASFARLSRRQVPAPEGGYRVIVVDEAHRLRNPSTKGYRALVELAAGARVLLVTASPIHNRRDDLVALLDLVARGAGSEGDLDRLRWRLRRVTVRRTRWTVTDVYPRDRGPLFAALVVPQRSRVTRVVSPGAGLEALLAELPRVAQALMPERDADDGRELLAMLLAKRLESSPAALLATLKRGRNYLVRADEAARRGERLSRDRFRALFGADPEGQVAQYLLPFFFGGAEALTTAFTSQLAAVDRALAAARLVAAGEDAKLAAAREATGGEGRTVVMTEYEDTARYVLAHLGGERWLLTGRGAWSSRTGRVERREVLRAFGPRAVGAGERATLVATDVLREGVNLQGATHLVHYDLPWSPMALEQRFGRLDRLGGPGRTVWEVTLRLGGAFEPWLRLEDRLRAKRAEAASVLSGLGAPERDRAGFDRDGLLMACRARIEAPAIGPMGTGWTEPGWLIAMTTAGDVRIYWTDASGCREAPVDLLVAVASGAVPNPCQVAPPRAVLSEALLVAERAGHRERLWALEPDGSDRSRRAEAAALGSRARAAHRRGDIAVLGKCDALSAAWAACVPARAALPANARLPVGGEHESRLAEPWTNRGVTFLGALRVGAEACELERGRGESADVGALGHADQTTANRQGQG